MDKKYGIGKMCLHTFKASSMSLFSYFIYKQHLVVVIIATSNYFGCGRPQTHVQAEPQANGMLFLHVSILNIDLIGLLRNKSYVDSLNLSIFNQHYKQRAAYCTNSTHTDRYNWYTYKICEYRCKQNKYILAKT